jgi:hypothetical protein
MRVVVAVAACVGLAAASPALAARIDHSCIAAGKGPARIAATVAQPKDCCSGRMQCAQFLSTTRLVRPGSQERT